MKNLILPSFCILLLLTSCSLFPDFNKKEDQYCHCPPPPQFDPWRIKYYNKLGQNLLVTSIAGHYLSDSIYLFKYNDAKQLFRNDSMNILVDSNANGGYIQINSIGYNPNRPYTESITVYLHLNDEDNDTIFVKYDRTLDGVAGKVYYNGVYQPVSNNGYPTDTIIKNY
jgi:hypothetical protein